VDVAPALRDRVRGGPIQFHPEAVVLVKIVQIPAAPAEGYRHLTARGRQAMRTLD
jgi:hypothetical protein